MAKEIVFDSATVNTTAEVPMAYVGTVTDRAMAPLLLSVFQGYCEAVFETLAEQSPRELEDIVRNCRGPNSRLTFAAEILGQVDTASAVNALEDALRDHPSPLVREGAVLGLEHHLHRPGVREALAAAHRSEVSPGVREALAEALEE